MLKQKPVIDDILDALVEDGSFNETLKEFVEGQFDGHAQNFKYQMDIILENVMRRLFSKDEDAMDARKMAAS